MKTKPLLSSVLILGASAAQAATSPDPTHRLISSITGLEDKPRAKLPLGAYPATNSTRAPQRHPITTRPVAKPMTCPNEQSAASHQLHSKLSPAQHGQRTEAHTQTRQTPDPTAPLTLPPLVRRSVLKMLAKGGTHPLSTAIKNSATQGLARPQLRQGNFNGVLSKIGMTGIDNFLYEQVDQRLDRLLVKLFQENNHPVDPLKHAGIQLFKEALTCLIVIAAMRIAENAHQSNPLHQGMLSELGITLTHLWITNHVSQMTQHRIAQLMAKMTVPLLMSAYDGKAMASNIANNPQIGSPTSAYVAGNMLAKTLQILSFELLKWLIPPTPSKTP